MIGTKRTENGTLSVANHLIVIGAPKSGTTWLRDALAGTPGFWLGGRTETHYFDRSTAPNASEYSELFRSAPTDLVTVDVTPDYLICLEAIRHMSKLNEAMQRDVKLVVLLREPARRSFSHYQMLLDQDRAAGGFFKNFHKGNPVYDASCYGYWLSKWCDHSSNVPLRAFLFEDLVAEPRRIILDIMRFCGILEPNSVAAFLPQRTNVGGISRSRAWPCIRRYFGSTIRKVGGESAVLNLKNSALVRRLDSFNKRQLNFDGTDEKLAREDLAEDVECLALLFPELGAKAKWGY